ncbi:MAG: hypothetical protein CMJ78_25970 [Planctomycetaceae bacterium]|nr:hypothetical protein [Planctomycetaceae bacterium]
MSQLTRQWLALRFVAPIVIGCVLLTNTRGRPFFDVFGPLVWTLFAVHVLCTFSFKRTHVLDTGAFFILIFMCITLANINERGILDSASNLIVPGTAFSIYLLLSFIGIKRADATLQPRDSISLTHVVGGLVILFAAVLVCSISKTAVGFLFVPGMFVPVILLYSLLRPN